MKPGPRTQTIEARFWPKVDRSDADGCWLWVGGRTTTGYGVFMQRKGRFIGAHRMSWVMSTGRDIPPGMVVMHSCDTPSCVNPAHLSVGTPKDNNADKTRKGRNPGNRTDRGRPISRIDGRVVANMVASGATYKAVGLALGCSAATAFRARQRYMKG